MRVAGHPFPLCAFWIINNGRQPVLLAEQLPFSPIISADLTSSSWLIAVMEVDHKSRQEVSEQWSLRRRKHYRDCVISWFKS